MTLKEYLQGKSAKERDAFYNSLTFNRIYVASLAAGATANGKLRRPGIDLAAQIELATGGKVTALEMLYGGTATIDKKKSARINGKAPIKKTAKKTAAKRKRA